MSKDNRLRPVLYEALEAELDPPLSAHSFRRNKRSLDYHRKLHDAKQTLTISLFVNPRYEKAATGHLYPLLRVAYPEVCRVSLEMVGGNSWLLANTPESTFSHPLDFVIPKQHHVRWFTYDHESVPGTIRSIREAVLTWGVPFLDHFTKMDAFLTAYENLDDRITWQPHVRVRVAAAYLLKEEPGKARSVLEAAFTTLALRYQYSTTLDYVEKYRDAK